VHYTTSCKHSLVLLRMGEIIARNMLSLLWLSIKFVIVASSWLFILLYQWCTVTQTLNPFSSFALKYQQIKIRLVLPSMIQTHILYATENKEHVTQFTARLHLLHCNIKKLNTSRSFPAITNFQHIYPTTPIQCYNRLPRKLALRYLIHRTSYNLAVTHRGC
jgi:hypothetical protein